jgi:hypothetical protein
MTMGQEPKVNTLCGLSLAKYVLERLVNNHGSIEKIAENFDNDKRFILGVTNFLNGIDWIKQDSSGTSNITSKRKTNTITRCKQMVIIGV